MFLSYQGQPVPNLAEILGVQVWASWKFPWCMCRVVSNVTEVIVRLESGTRTSVWAKHDEQGH